MIQTFASSRPLVNDGMNLVVATYKLRVVMVLVCWWSRSFSATQRAGAHGILTIF